MITCPSCQASIEDGTETCPHCGTSLTDVAPTPGAQQPGEQPVTPADEPDLSVEPEGAVPEPAPELPAAEEPVPEMPLADAGTAVPPEFEPAPEIPAAGAEPPLPPLPPEPVPAPAVQPTSGLAPDSQTWGMLAHLSALVGLAIGFSLLGPLVVWLIKKDQDPYVDYHGKEALNFNISVLIYIVGAVIVMIISFVSVVLIPVGILLILALVALGVGWLVLTIIAGLAANRGDYYRYPLTIRFIS